MSINKDELAKLSGEEYYLVTPRMNYISIKLNGTIGEFIKSIPPEKKGDKYTKENMGSTLQGVILRVRRRLSDYGNNLYTNEHDSTRQRIKVYEAGKQADEGDYAYIREKYQGLRTEQIVYTLVGNEVFKVLVSGASLQSKSKPKDSIPFYEYLGSFDRTKGEHAFEYITEFVPKSESGKLGTYFAISFERGRQITDDELATVAEKVRSLASQINDREDYQASLSPSTRESSFEYPENESQETDAEELPTIQVEDEKTEDFNVEDIPF